MTLPMLGFLCFLCWSRGMSSPSGHRGMPCWSWADANLFLGCLSRFLNWAWQVYPSALTCGCTTSSLHSPSTRICQTRRTSYVGEYCMGISRVSVEYGGAWPFLSATVPSLLQAVWACCHGCRDRLPVWSPVGAVHHLGGGEQGPEESDCPVWQGTGHTHAVLLQTLWEVCTHTSIIKADLVCGVLPSSLLLYPWWKCKQQEPGTKV